VHGIFSSGAHAPRCNPTIPELRCPVRPGVHRRRLRFDGCHVDWAIARQVCCHPRCTCVGGQRQWRYGDCRRNNAARMRMVGLIGRALDHRSYAFLRARERTTADADRRQPRCDRAPGRHHGE
jgi:hypothetical protein